MRAITFDIETANAFPTLARGDLSRMEISVVGIHDSLTGEYTTYLKEDFPQLWPLFESADLIIGFNSDSFDIPLLNRYYPGDLTSIPSLDILSKVYDAVGRRIRLQSLAEATLGESKSGNGLEAVTWWQQGDYDKVRAYCIDDVRITRGLYDYARKHNSLKFKDLGGPREFKIDARSWEDTTRDSSITHTLPF